MCLYELGYIHVIIKPQKLLLSKWHGTCFSNMFYFLSAIIPFVTNFFPANHFYKIWEQKEIAREQDAAHVAKRHIYFFNRTNETPSRRYWNPKKSWPLSYWLKKRFKYSFRFLKFLHVKNNVWRTAICLVWTIVERNLIKSENWHGILRVDV